MASRCLSGTVRKDGGCVKSSSKSGWKQLEEVGETYHLKEHNELFPTFNRAFEAHTRRQKNIGLSELVKHMTEEDWYRVYANQFELHKLGEAIESTAKRKKLPIAEVAEEYHQAYFGPAFPESEITRKVRRGG